MAHMVGLRVLSRQARLQQRARSGANAALFNSEQGSCGRGFVAVLQSSPEVTFFQTPKAMGYADEVIE
ncbi:MAG TPA: hypothetical protein VFZ28_09590 [Burkholderiaceae bacterium]|nr:hypothetical protein [Burkholderiaceae bacterium]